MNRRKEKITCSKVESTMTRRTSGSVIRKKSDKVPAPSMIAASSISGEMSSIAARINSMEKPDWIHTATKITG